MSDQVLSLLYALGATLCFSSSSLVYADYSKRASVLWMNCFKAAVAFCALALTVPLFGGWHSAAGLAIGGFVLSGFIGLNIGDLFLLQAFTRLGVARTLILFGFQPLFVGIGAYFLFGQPLEPRRFVAVVFLIGCLLTFSLEKFRTEKRWEVAGLFFALMGVLLDTFGILLSRASFSASPALTPLEGHFYRCFGALVGFAAISYFFRPVHLIRDFLRWPVKERTLLILASLGGTYLSLLLYLSAVKIGHLASIAGIAITGPMFATVLESFIYRRKPTPYLLVAFALFCAGFYILLAA